jgi:hypothetical protein
MPRENTVRIRKGLYVTRLDELPPKSLRKAPMFVINAVCGSLRNRYIAPNMSIPYFVIEWDSNDLSWKDYQDDILGDRYPDRAQPSSIRGTIFGDWKRLGLESAPNSIDNCIHGSSSALDGLRDRLLWVKGSLLFTDLFGSRLLAERIPSSIIKKIIDAKTTERGQNNIRNYCTSRGSSECVEIILKAIGNNEV